MPEHEFKPGITSLVAGFCCWLGDFLTYPIDTLSTRQKGMKNPLKVPWLTYMREGIVKHRLKLYRGGSLTIPHSFIPTCIYVMVYENLMHKSVQITQSFGLPKSANLALPFLFSAFAEAVTMIIELPFDTVRTRIQMDSPDYQYSSAKEGLTDIMKRQGFWRFYRSTKIYIVSKSFYTSVQFQTYETLNFFNTGFGVYSVFLNAVISAVVATTAANPFEVLITQYALVDTSKKQLALVPMIKRLWNQEGGIKGFYKGYGTELLLHSLYALFWIPAYQFARDYFGVNLKD